MVELIRKPIDTQRLLAAVRSRDAGAVVLFLGTAREFTDGRRTRSLEYDGYDEMANKELQKLDTEARRRWPIVQCHIVHRLGHLELGEASVAVAISTAHRQDAFEAARWIMDRLKESVPIWKRENWADGTSTWVHPGWDETQTP